MIRKGNTTVIVTIALSVVASVGIVCFTALKMSQPAVPGGGGTVVGATYKQQLDPILDGSVAQFYAGVFEGMAVDLESDAPTATTWAEYQKLMKSFGKAANNGEPISVNLTPFLTQVFEWSDGKSGPIVAADQKHLADTFRQLGEAAKDCE